MAYPEIAPVISVVGGGKAPVVIEDPLFEHTPHIFSILGGFDDDGGHTGELREVIKMLSQMFPDRFKLLSGAIGDASRRMVGHIRIPPEEREPFDFRWPEGDHNLNGHRSITEMLAVHTVYEGGSLFKGIQRLSRRLADFVGAVIPASDDAVDLGILYADGTYKVGEKYIDKMQLGDSPIEEIVHIPHQPKLLPEAKNAIKNSDLIIISPGTFHGSIYPPCLMPEFIETISEAREEGGTVALIINALNHPETEGWPGSKYCEKLIEVGIHIDVAFLNELTHKIPETYEQDEGALPVTADEDKCEQLVDKLIYKPLTSLVWEKDDLVFKDGVLGYEKSRQVVRHSGEIIANELMKILHERNARVTRRNEFLSRFSSR